MTLRSDGDREIARPLVLVDRCTPDLGEDGELGAFESVTIGYTKTLGAGALVTEVVTAKFQPRAFFFIKGKPLGSSGLDDWRGAPTLVADHEHDPTGFGPLQDPSFDLGHNHENKSTRIVDYKNPKGRTTLAAQIIKVIDSLDGDFVPAIVMGRSFGVQEKASAGYVWDNENNRCGLLDTVFITRDDEMYGSGREGTKSGILGVRTDKHYVMPESQGGWHGALWISNLYNLGDPKLQLFEQPPPPRAVSKKRLFFKQKIYRDEEAKNADTELGKENCKFRSYYHVEFFEFEETPPTDGGGGDGEQESIPPSSSGPPISNPDNSFPPITSSPQTSSLPPSSSPLESFPPFSPQTSPTEGSPPFVPVPGPKGDKGDKGDPGKDGSPGKEGKQGPVGPQGPPGVCECDCGCGGPTHDDPNGGGKFGGPVGLPNSPMVGQPGGNGGALADPVDIEPLTGDEGLDIPDGPMDGFIGPRGEAGFNPFGPVSVGPADALRLPGALDVEDLLRPAGGEIQGIDLNDPGAYGVPTIEDLYRQATRGTLGGQTQERLFPFNPKNLPVGPVPLRGVPTDVFAPFGPPRISAPEAVKLPGVIGYIPMASNPPLPSALAGPLDGTAKWALLPTVGGGVGIAVGRQQPSGGAWQGPDLAGGTRVLGPIRPQSVQLPGGGFVVTLPNGSVVIGTASGQTLVLDPSNGLLLNGQPVISQPKDGKVTQAPTINSDGVIEFKDVVILPDERTEGYVPILNEDGIIEWAAPPTAEVTQAELDAVIADVADHETRITTLEGAGGSGIPSGLLAARPLIGVSAAGDMYIATDAYASGGGLYSVVDI